MLPHCVRGDAAQCGVSYHDMCLFLLHRATFCRAGDACDDHQVVTALQTGVDRGQEDGAEVQYVTDT